MEAEVKECPACRTRTKGPFPDTMPGPLQYGAGLQAFVINLLVAHMLSLRRAVALVQAVTGLRLSEATCLGYLRRLHEALRSWEDAAIAQLLERPALHADETGFRVDRRTQWLHLLTDGSLTLKFLHPKRGREAVDAVGVIPRYTGVLIHDGWPSYFVYDQCRHQLCGAHLLRELTFIVDSNGFRWARLMKKLLRGACHRVNKSATKTRTGAACRSIIKRYRTILAHGGKELPDIPPRPKGQPGRIAKSDAHNLHERLVKHEDSVLRFISDPHANFTHNTAEQKIRMAKVKIKVSGCFRSRLHADAWCRIPSYLNSMVPSATTPSSPSRSLSPETPPTSSHPTSPGRGEQLPQGKDVHVPGAQVAHGGDHLPDRFSKARQTRALGMDAGVQRLDLRQYLQRLPVAAA